MADADLTPMLHQLPGGGRDADDGLLAAAEACAEDADLRREIEALLAADEAAGGDGCLDAYVLRLLGGLDEECEA